MAGKLDQSLDDILKTRRTNSRRPGRRPGTAAKAASATTTASPVGGVKKSTRPARSPGKAAIPTGPASGSGESKIIVSNLPADVNETQIKDYFSKTIGPVKKVFLTYGPNGQSRGVSTIVFSKPNSAAEAAKQLNGVKVDNRSMRIEVVVTADQVPVRPEPKSLSDRVQKPKAAAKAQPKPASETKATAAAGRGGRSRRGRGRNAGRAKAKTAEELDAEMQDYFGGDANGAATADGDTNMATTNGGAVQPTAATGGDAMAEDDNDIV